MTNRNSFDYRKSIQAINYFVRKYPDSRLNLMKALKLLWAADRYHLRKYGRATVYDEYVAMPYGPVQSTTRDILERNSYLEDKVEYADKYLKAAGYDLESILEVDDNLFSDTDVEAFEFAFIHFGDKNKWELCELTHQYPEWKKFQEKFDAGKTRVELMDYLDFFNDPSIPNDVFELDKKMLLESKEIFEENKKISSLWNY